jgi:hypothetical protein
MTQYFSFVLWLLSAAAMAQTPNTAAVVVAVVDQTGAVIRNAQIRVVNTATGASREVTSGPEGSATIGALPLTGSYSIAVAKAGFTSRTIENVVLRAGETATVEVPLVASGGVSDVTVYGTTEGVRRDPQLGVRLDAERIEEAPNLGRKITALPLLNAAFRTAKGTGDLFLNNPLFVANAGGRRQTTVALDGATADEPWGRQTMFSNVPETAVQEMQVLSNAFSAEFGWTTSSALNIVTKAGTNQLSGDVLFLDRPEGPQEETVEVDGTRVNTADVPDVLKQISGALGGPLARDRTHFFAAAEFSRQDRTAILTSPLRPSNTYDGRYEQTLADARIDGKLNASHTLMGRFNLDRFFDTNPQDAVSGIVLPSAGREFRRHTYAVQFNETAVLSDAMLNEARVEWQNGDPITQFEPLMPSTQFTRAGIATEGESRAAHVFSRQTEFSDTLTWIRGRHDFRVGGSVARATSGGDGTEFGSAFVLGQFTVSSSAGARPLSDLRLSDVTRYSQSFDFGKRTYESSQWIYAVFVQDHFRLRRDLDLDLGLRYDRQTFSDATSNFAPRIGFGWNPFADPKTAVRGGYGMYYSQLRGNLAANFELGGPEGMFSYSASPGQLGFPSSLDAAPIVFPPGAVLPARNITIRPGRPSYYERFFDLNRLTRYPDALTNPRSQVTSIGLERGVGRGCFVSADYVHQHWTDIDRTLDLNAPSVFVRTAPGQTRSAAAADATRPIVPGSNGFRQINAVVNDGVADYDGLQTELRRRTRRYVLSLSYTLSKSTNTVEPDAPGGGPNDSNFPGEEERGPSALDQRHRAVLTFVYWLPYAISAGTVAQLASARPYNATTGVDNNGDGLTTDRPVLNGSISSRNAFRGTGTSDIALFAGARIKAGHGAVTIRAEVFNLFNHANVLGRNGVYGDAGQPSSNFDTPLAGLASVEPARMAQFLVRYAF